MELPFADLAGFLAWLGSNATAAMIIGAISLAIADLLTGIASAYRWRVFTWAYVDNWSRSSLIPVLVISALCAFLHPVIGAMAMATFSAKTIDSIKSNVEEMLKAGEMSPDGPDIFADTESTSPPIVVNIDQEQ